MLKKIAVACICCFLALQTFAQKQASDSVTTRYKWEVGTDLLWLIDKNSMPATTVFIRRHLERPNRIPSAIRMRLGFGLDGRDHRPGHWTQVVDYEESFSPYLRAGYEWQVPKGRLQLFYGADAHVSYWVKNSKDVDWLDFNQPNGEMWEMISYTKHYRLNTGVVGFAGAKYFLSSQISLSTEVSYELIHSIDDIKRRDYIPRLDEAGVIYKSGASGKTTSWYGRFIPISVINLSFHF